MKLSVLISGVAVLCTLAKEKAEQLPEYREFERQREEALRDLQR
jgi:hypothetical protein